MTIMIIYFYLDVMVILIAQVERTKRVARTQLASLVLSPAKTESVFYRAKDVMGFLTALTSQMKRNVQNK